MYATLERAASGYLVEGGGMRIWLDAGGGTWQHLQQHCDWRSLDAVMLTHRHPDHTIDVLQGFHARQYGGPDPLERIPLFAPQETLDRLLAFSSELDLSFDCRAIDVGDEVDLAAGKFSFVRMAHPVVTLGVRIEAGDSVFAYSADSGPNADFAALAGGADVFICEATFQDSDEEWEGHLRSSQAGAIAAEMDCGRLLLTHLPAERDLDLSLKEARQAAPDLDIQLAYDGMQLKV